jgi:RNA recognition motif-containing protein
MGNRVYVGNLAFDTTEDSLRAAVRSHGEPTEVKIVTDRDTGQSRGFAFVTMASDEHAKRLISKLDGSSLDGRALRVNEAEDRRPPAGGRGRR